VATAAILAGLIAMVLVRHKGWQLPESLSTFSIRANTSAASPEDAVYNMLDALAQERKSISEHLWTDVCAACTGYQRKQQDEGFPNISSLRILL